MEELNDNYIKLCYDKWHSSLEPDQHGNAPWYQMVRNSIVPEKDLDDKTVLEIGCGSGGFACWLARHPSTPKKVVAADFSDTAIFNAKSIGELQLTKPSFVVADITSLTIFETNSFDTVFSCETIEHVPNPQLALHELSRVLRPGGNLYLTAPNYFSTIGLYRLYCLMRGRKFTECGQPINQFTTVFNIRKMVLSAGLKISKIHSCGHYIPFPGRPPLEFKWLGYPNFMMKWFGHHLLIVAKK